MKTISLVLLLGVSFVVRADDWPQFRGANRDSLWNETGIMQTFPEKGLLMDEFHRPSFIASEK